MNNWKIVCDKVSSTMDLSEREFEKGVATLILSFLGWNEFRSNIQEQYHIEDHAKGYYPDFALFPKGQGMPGIYVELKQTGHKMRTKDIKQIRTYMMLTDCRFCIYFGEKMELFFIKIDGTHRSLKSVLSLDYNPQNPYGNVLLDLINYDNFNEEKLLSFCEDRLAADEAADYYTSEEGQKRLIELLVKDHHLSDGAARLLPSMLTMPERKKQEVETINDDEPKAQVKLNSTKSKEEDEFQYCIDDFRVFSEKSVGQNTTRNYIRHLRDNVSKYVKSIISNDILSVFSITSSLELKDCISTLKNNNDFVAANKEKRYFFTASLSKYLEFLENREGAKAPTPKTEKTKKGEKKPKERKNPRPPFKFSMIGLSIGNEVIFDPKGWKVKVASENMVEYEGEILRMTTFCKKFLPDNMRNKSEAYQGPDYFSYGGKTLAKIRDEKENFTYLRKKR